MKKPTIHYIWGLLDILVFACIYFFIYRPTIDISTAIASQAEVIRYETHMYIVIVSVVIPGHHFLSLIGTFLPKYSDRFVHILYSTFILLIIFGVGMTVKIKHDIKQNGYSYCEAVSSYGNHVHFAAYLRDKETCDRLAMEEFIQRRRRIEK